MKTSKVHSFLTLVVLAFPVMPVTGQGPLITHPVIEKIGSGFNFVEGPLWVDSLGLLFSDIPENKVYRWNHDSVISTYLTPSGRSNGLALDRSGLLILAQHLDRQVGRLEKNGTITSLATHYDGKRLNSPNDLAVKSDGSVFFTDPPYGLNDQGGISELGYYGIYRLSPFGTVQLLDNSLNRPNGITFSPDESKIYVTDSETRKIYVWDIEQDSILSGKREFAWLPPAGYADGMKTDSGGYLYVAGPLGIWVLDPGGTPVDTFLVPGQTTNCAWGGPSYNDLFVTSGNSVYRIRKGEPVKPTGIAHNSRSANSATFLCHPNPFTNTLHYDYWLDVPGVSRLDLYAASGRRVARLWEEFHPAGPVSGIWDISALPAATYILVLVLPDHHAIHRCMVKNQ